MSERLFNENDGMDEDVCLGMYDNDYDFYKLVLDTFLQDIIRTLNGMKETFAAKDVENYRIFVHGLKGAGGSVGAKHLVELATRSNDLIKSGQLEEAYSLHEPLVNELERLIEIIPERIQSHNG
ncbi:MAG: Hpt domain-containing protein [Lachnospiraceae bacterium]|nr:Hpt domain-containing protein [Lachnospiraceae bacterium]